jgi:hypothetical protein
MRCQSVCRITLLDAPVPSFSAGSVLYTCAHVADVANEFSDCYVYRVYARSIGADTALQAAAALNANKT